MNKIINYNSNIILYIIISIFLIIATYFSISLNITNYNEKSRLLIEKNIFNNNTFLNKLIHTLQKERGLSAGYISSKGKNFALLLKKQRKITNKTIVVLKNNIKTTNTNQEYIKNAFIKLDKIEIFRNKIDLLSLSVEENIKYYSGINKEIIDYISYSSILNSNKITSDFILSYMHLLEAKEYTGIQRALTTVIFSSDTIKNYDLINKLITLHDLEKRAIDDYKIFLNDNLLDTFNKNMSDKSIENVKRLLEVTFSEYKKRYLIADIKSLLGYGGLIHNFKNYLLRKEDKYYQQFLINYKEIINIINSYKIYKNITEQEKRLLNIIAKTINDYFQNIKIIVKNKDKTIQKLDSLVKVNDKQALYSIKNLEKNFFTTSYEYNFSIFTEKIKILEKIEENHFSYISNLLDDKINKISSDLNINMFISIILIFLIFVNYSIILQVKNIKKEVKNKKDMISIFTHELKTPLNAIIGLSSYIAEVLNERKKDEELVEIAELNNNIHINGMAQLNMVENILELTKFESNNIILHPEDINISALTHEIVDKYQGAFKRETNFNLDDNIIIHKDKKIISMIIENLYSNALKYSKSEILITIEINNDNNFSFTIEDDGDGIKDEDKSKIFNMFEQVDKEVYVREKSGTGIGLYTVSCLAKLCNINVYVDKSQFLGGAKFIID